MKGNCFSLIDTHLHWDQFPEDQMEGIVNQALQAKVEKAVAVATDPRSCLDLLQWKKRFPEFLVAGFGLHPEYHHGSQDKEQVLRLIGEHRDQIHAVGEVGLPYYRLREEERYCPPERESIRRLEEFLRIARDLDLPVILHAVHTMAAPVLDALLKIGVKRGVFHWLKAPKDVVDAILKANFYISVTPEVCYRERDQELVKQVSLDSLLLETDAPWPYHGLFKGQTSEPSWILESAKEVAAIKGIEVQTVAEKTTANARKLFAL